MAHPVARHRALGAAAAVALAGCGLVNHDVTVSQAFQAGGSAPNAIQLDSSKLTQPVAASAGDLSKLSSVKLLSAHLASTDSGDLSYVAGATLTLSANGLPDLALATLPSAPTAGQGDVALQADSKTDLRPYLAAGGLIKAELGYSPRPVTARGLQLVLVLRASL